MTTSEVALLDANILIYNHQALSKFHPQAKALLEKGLRGETELCICPQVLFEFFAVVTNPRRVTSPINSEAATQEIERYLRARNILKIYPKDDILNITVELLKKYGAREKDIFDLQLAATMLSNNVTRLYSYNLDDFIKIKEIEVLAP
jgi:toxin-antitoxin system PIN domain toxin